MTHLYYNENKGFLSATFSEKKFSEHFLSLGGLLRLTFFSECYRVTHSERECLIRITKEKQGDSKT